MASKEAPKFEVLRTLSKSDLQELESIFAPELLSLRELYASDLPMDDSMLTNPQYLDVLRTAWFLDGSALKPEAQTVTGALGFAFGCLLAKTLGMEWSAIRDDYGETLSLVYVADYEQPNLPRRVSFPPFNYVEKREEIGNAEVFQDGLAAVRRLIQGQAV